MTNKAAVFAQKLLKKSLDDDASDIHFHPSPLDNHVDIYYRKLGKRVFVQAIPRPFYQMVLTYFKFSAKMDLGFVRQPQDGVMTWQDQHRFYQLRLSTLPVHYTESLTIRIFAQEKPPKLKDLFLFPNQYRQLKTWIDHQAGLFLFTGKTGSGKSTTMYSLIDELVAFRTCQVITLEEPIERKMNQIIQVEVNERAGLSYERALKAALRHDPDVILIGEIRDEKTASFAVRAALTGHLVLSTLHANSAMSTIERLCDLGVKSIDLQQTLLGIASLELLPIIARGEISRRAAIVEMLDGKLLKKVLKGERLEPGKYLTFQALKEKAYRYGFIDEKIYQETKA